MGIMSLKAFKENSFLLRCEFPCFPTFEIRYQLFLMLVENKKMNMPVLVI